MVEDREADGGDVLGRAIGGAVAQLQELVAQLKTLIDVRVDRARIGAREAAFNLAFSALIFVAGSTLVVFATFFIARGIAGLVAELSGRPWAGDLFGGLLTLSLLLWLILGTRGWLRRRGAARLRQRYEGRDGGGGDA